MLRPEFTQAEASPSRVTDWGFFGLTSLRMTARKEFITQTFTQEALFRTVMLIRLAKRSKPSMPNALFMPGIVIRKYPRLSKIGY